MAAGYDLAMPTPAAHAFTVVTPGGPVTIHAPGADAAAAIRGRVEAWLRGAADDFADVPTPAGTAFQRACWEACRSIPSGETRSYAWLAAAAGSPRAVRAAGQAMRRNPLPIVVPCHRVVGSGGWIGGYAGDAGAAGATVAVKRGLLELEARGADVPSRARRAAANGRARTGDPTT